MKPSPSQHSPDDAVEATAGAPDAPGSGLRTGLAAATYTVVAAAQKGSGFLLLIAFTRVLAPADYGQIALLTTVGALLMMVMTLGLEPRIMYAYVRAEAGHVAYLRTAKRVSLLIPFAVAAALAALLLALPIDDPGIWIMECVGATLLAAGTTYAYAVLRSARRALPYAVLALGLLVAQVAGRIAFVAVLDWGPAGWAASDLLTGVAAVVAGPLVARAPRPVANEPGCPMWTVVRGGLPLVPHYLAQWGLSLSDRLILAVFVSTAAVGIYSAIYQIAAVISLMLSEVNRAFMPSYARHPPGAPGIAPLVRLHLKVTFVLYGVLFLLGFAAVLWLLPSEYSSHDELYPALAVASLLYGLYFIPMNGLTLVAGVTRTAPFISLGAFGVNVAVNLALDGSIGVWGAVVATGLGYLTLTGLALVFCQREHAIPWRAVGRSQALNLGAFTAIGVLALLTTWPGATRLVCVVAMASVLAVLASRLAVDVPGRLRLGSR